ncbi:MAG TPA: NADH-quinone oxidoreductase subunit K [Marmoricola sp.]|nr:NADH-quinone oxidoreductase subunit K [Marmoricola sp.]
MLDAVLAWLPYAVAGWILLVGCVGIVISNNYVHAVVCLGLVQSATYLLLLAIGWSPHATAPVFSDVPPGTNVVDPVVQAMTLTDVVVGAAVTALLLALTVQLAKRHGTLDPDEVRSLESDQEEDLHEEREADTA